LNDNHDDFKWMGKFGGLFAFGMIMLLILCAILFVFGLIFFGVAGIFSLLGVSYDSVKALVYFTGIMLLIDFFLDPISKLLAGLFSRVYQYQHYKRFMIRTLFIIAFSSLSFYIADECIAGINIPVRTELLLGLISCLIEIVFEERPKQEKN